MAGSDNNREGGAGKRSPLAAIPIAMIGSVDSLTAISIRVSVVRVAMTPCIITVAVMVAFVFAAGQDG